MAEPKAPQPSHTQLRVGRLTKAHGLKGAIKVELYTDAPERRFVPGAVFSLQVPTSSDWHGKKLELIELKFYNAQPVAFFKGDKNAKSTVKTKEAKEVFQADEKKKPVLKPKTEKPVEKVEAPAEEAPAEEAVEAPEAAAEVEAPAADDADKA